MSLFTNWGSDQVNQVWVKRRVTGDGIPDAAAELYGATLAAEDVQVYYQVVINGRRDLPWVPDPRLGFEMTLLRLLAFRPGGAGCPAGGPAARPPRASVPPSS